MKYKQSDLFCIMIIKCPNVYEYYYVIFDPYVSNEYKGKLNFKKTKSLLFFMNFTIVLIIKSSISKTAQLSSSIL